ncbi:MAG: GGDEF domain-containing protein [Burkholderiales bacterium]|nr:GGDEF domain-containing protein [Burkholderiales bacterium]
MKVTPEQYRTHYLEADIAQWRFALVLFAVPNIIFAWIDYTVIGPGRMLHVYMTLRAILVVFSAALWHYLRTLRDFRRLDWLMLLWSLTGLAVIFLNVFGRPVDYFGHYAFEVFAVLVFFAACPLPPSKQVIVAACYLLPSIVLLLNYKTRSLPFYTSNLLFVMVLAVISGYLISVRINRYRMSAFEAQRNLELQAKSDPLTGIANRRAFLDAARGEMARVERTAEPAAVLMLDIDHFKAINDRHGHELGDLLLIAFTQRIQAALRPYDHFARFGGEEFVVLLPGTAAADAAALADRLRRVIGDQLFVVSGQAVPMTMSVGVAAVRPDNASLDCALRRADAAMYSAKKHGRNRVEVDATYRDGATMKAA